MYPNLVQAWDGAGFVMALEDNALKETHQSRELRDNAQALVLKFMKNFLMGESQLNATVQQKGWMQAAKTVSKEKW